MSIQRDVDPVKDKILNKMLDDKYGHQTKRIITGDELRTIKALLVQKALEKRAVDKHGSHDQSTHAPKTKRPGFGTLAGRKHKIRTRTGQGSYKYGVYRGSKLVDSFRERGDATAMARELDGLKTGPDEKEWAGMMQEEKESGELRDRQIAEYSRRQRRSRRSRKVTKRTITKHPGHPDQSVHGKKGAAPKRTVKVPREEYKVLARQEKRRLREMKAAARQPRKQRSKPKAKEGIASRLGRVKSRVTRALRGATPMGMGRLGQQLGRRLRSRKMTKTEQVNSIMKRMREIIKAHTG